MEEVAACFGRGGSSTGACGGYRGLKRDVLSLVRRGMDDGRVAIKRVLQNFLFAKPRIGTKLAQ